MSVASNRQFRSHVIQWFLLVAGLVLTITGYSLYRSAEVHLIDKFKLKHLLLATNTAAFIDGDSHRLFLKKSAGSNKTYKHYQKAIDRTLASGNASKNIYTLLVNIKNEKLFYGIVSQSPNALDKGQKVGGSQFIGSDNFKNLVLEFYEKGSKNDSFLISDLANNKKLLSLALIQDSHNKPAGVVVVEVSNKEIVSLKEKLLESMLVTISLLFITLLIASIFFARKITGPFEQLTDAIERLIKNDFNFNLSLSGFGGFTYLAKQFNLMLLKLQVSRNELVGTNKAYSRFVPHNVLKLISPNGIKNISLGDCIEKEMTILFCDIRGFTRLSESMSPNDSFKFINQYLKLMVPVINQHGGTIDKYMGDGIMALFPNSADDALNAAVGMLQSLDKYNKKLIEKNLPAVEIGLGLHTGEMMLGTVGTNSRMDVTVVSDTVNAAARIEALTKTFNCPILVSEETRLRLKDFDKQNLRFIATCFVQGKSRPMTIYEVFSQDTISLRKEKLANQNLMIDAWDSYKNGNSEKAISLYQKAMERCPEDKAQLALLEVVQKGRL